MERKYYLAIDIGASSGRHIIGYLENGAICVKEIYRFRNAMTVSHGHLTWDIDKLVIEIKNGLKLAFFEYKHIESVAIDTWGVDYVLLKGKKEVLPVYAYRDSRTVEILEEIENIIPKDFLYRNTGIQYQQFNTIYQLFLDKKDGRLDGVTDFLMMPEYINFKLTGKKIKEYTNATTTGFINAFTKQFDREIINKLGFSENLFPPLHYSGEIVGELLIDVQKEVIGNTKVILCPSHDTASAFYAVDTDDESIYISSGTWSLVGTKIKEPITSVQARECNFTNEGGVGYIRFLKNITGMWINVNLSHEFNKLFEEMDKLCLESNFDCIFDVNAEDFTSPKSMSNAIKNWFEKHEMPLPQSEGDYIRSAYRSLAYAYKIAIEEIEEVTKKKYKKIYIVGGGAKNKFLNDTTHDFTGKEVIAMPIEATAIGNIKSQMEAKYE